MAICLIGCGLTAAGRDDWHDPALMLSGRVAVGAVEPGGSPAIVHVRMKARAWSLCWQSAEGECRATLTLPPDDRKDDVYFTPAILTVETGGIVNEYRVDADVAADGYNSIKIDYDGVAATLMVGDETARDVANVPFGAGEVYVSVDGGGSCRRMQLSRLAPVAETRRHGGSLRDLLDRVSTSDDRNEGLWEYFGAESDVSKVTVGGRYIVATVSDGAGGYDIVYVAGAESNSGPWEPMTLKGHLRPTIFSGDYDLEWIDAVGNGVSGDTYARLSDDGSLLSAGFPSHGAMLKFRRVRPSEIIQKAGL